MQFIATFQTSDIMAPSNASIYTTKEWLYLSTGVAFKLKLLSRETQCGKLPLYLIIRWGEFSGSVSVN
jgi:hypothetical protein